MSAVLSGISHVADNALAPVAWSTQRYVYLQPSRDDFEYTDDGGTTWKTWIGDPDLQQSYPGAIKAAVNKTTGAWAFTVPWSDSEVKFSAAAGAGGSTPALQWNIIDPNVVSGLKVYYGPTLEAVVSSGKTLKQLLQLSSPDTWQVRSTTYTAAPMGSRRQGSVSFSAGQTLLSASWPSFGSPSWRCSLGVRTDDTGTFTANVVKGTETELGCDIRLSQAPDTGKTVQVDIEVW